jgi:hypothetical protein
MAQSKFGRTPVTLAPMKLVIAMLTASSLFAFGPQKQKKADVQIVETKVLRDAGKITVDGKVKVAAEKPLHGLVIVFDFRSPEKEVVTSQKTVVDQEPMTPGQEGAFHNEMVDAPRAVNYTVRAFDSHEKELRVANPGPYIIE